MKSMIVAAVIVIGSLAALPVVAADSVVTIEHTKGTLMLINSS